MSLVMRQQQALVESERMQGHVAQASLDVLRRAYPPIPERAVEQIKKPDLLSDTSKTYV